MSSAFEAIVGADHMSVGGGSRVDGVLVHAVVRPGSAAEVAACLARAAADGLACVVRGGGTKLGWGHPPRSEHLFLLDTSRLERPVALDAAEGIATLGGGVPVREVVRSAAELGAYTRLATLDADATVGGVVAADPLDPERTPDAALRADLLGLEVALANGTVSRCGGRVVKNVTGFDLVRLYCGSLGTLGVITEVTLRLRPLPELRRVFSRSYPSVEAALAGYRGLEASQAGTPPAAAAILRNGEAAELLWCLEGPRREVEARGADFAGEAAGDADWRRVGAALRETWTDHARVRVSARPSDLPSLVASLHTELGGAPSVVLPRVGSLIAQVEESRLAELIALYAGRGCAILVERASAAARDRCDVFGSVGGSLAVMRALKQRFDPSGVLAPGRFVGRL